VVVGESIVAMGDARRSSGAMQARGHSAGVTGRHCRNRNSDFEPPQSVGCVSTEAAGWGQPAGPALGDQCQVVSRSQGRRRPRGGGVGRSRGRDRGRRSQPWRGYQGGDFSPRAACRGRPKCRTKRSIERSCLDQTRWSERQVVLGGEGSEREGHVARMAGDRPTRTAWRMPWM